MPHISVQSKYYRYYRLGPLRATWCADGVAVLRYHVNVSHKLLHLHRFLSASEIVLLQQRLDALVGDWDELLERADGGRGVERVDAAEVQAFLNAPPAPAAAADWSRLAPERRFRPDPFPRPRPRLVRSVLPPVEPRIGFWDIFSGRAVAKKAAHSAAAERWQLAQGVDLDRYEHDRTHWQTERQAWNLLQAQKRAAFEQRQAEVATAIEEVLTGWASGRPEAILEQASLVLDALDRPGALPRNYDLDFRPETGTLVVELQLPVPWAFTGWQNGRDRVQAIYDALCLRLCLQAVEALYAADGAGHLQTVALNGMVERPRRDDGGQVREAILSLIAPRAEFAALDPGATPQDHFAALRGLAGFPLSRLAPVEPLVAIDRSRRQKVLPRAAALIEIGAINLSTLAPGDFEAVLSDLFELEFGDRGAELTIHDQENDELVQALAYDPDPVTGGKIVIEARRQPILVGIEAVRDLLRRVETEGARRGILLTTADIAPEAYHFASGKPLTLLSGTGLMHLLARHGIHARVDQVVRQRWPEPG